MDFLNSNQFKSLISYFNIAIDELNSNSSVICLRSNFRDSKDVHYFIDLFSAATKTNWFVYTSLKSPKRFEFRKKWKCGHNRSSAGILGCEAFIDVLIKKVNIFSKRNDTFLKRNPPLPGVIKIAFNHTHSVNSVADGNLAQLTLKDEVNREFCDYFSNGVRQQEVSHLHEAILLARGNKEEILKNTDINPSSHMVNYMYMTWRYHNPKWIADSFMKIEENKKHYEETGTSVFCTRDSPFAVLVVTDVMKRAQELISAMETIFVDTVLLNELGGVSFTIMLTATKVGAVPIAIVIHQDQTKDSYKKGFDLLKQHFPSCFAKDTSPKTFVTDDDDTIKSALFEIWPSSKQILCRFCIAISQWSYLWSNICAMRERPILMELFCNVIYARDQMEFEDAAHKLLSKEVEHPDFIQHFKALLERKHEWILFDRSDMKSSNLSNHAERTMRILKVAVLNHTKDFSLVTLIEFCILVLNEYLVKHLSNFTYKDSGKEAKLLYRSLIKRTNRRLEYESLDFNNYFVQSECKPNVLYLVNVTIGVCSCKIGSIGAFCKHQFVLLEEGKFKFPNLPVVTEADEYDLTLLALGDKCPLSHFLSTKEKRQNSAIKICNIVSLCSDSENTSDVQLYNNTSETTLDVQLYNNGLQTTSDVESVPPISHEYINDCSSEVHRVLSLLGEKVPASIVEKFTNTLKKIETESDAAAALQTMSLAVSAKIRAKTAKAYRRYNIRHHQRYS